MSYLPATPDALKAIRKAASAPAPAPLTAAQVHAAQLGATFQPGARVVDQLTGRQGTVINSAIVHGLKPIATPAPGTPGAPVIQLPMPTKTETVTVELDGGDVVARGAAWLAALPPALAVPLTALVPNG